MGQENRYDKKEQNICCHLLRATAGTAERVLAMAILSVCLSVCHDPVPNQAQVR